MGERGPLPRGEHRLRRAEVRILRALVRLGEATVPEIARRARMSPELVRYHLLKEGGLLARRYARVTIVSKARFRGRERAFRRFSWTVEGRVVVVRKRAERPPPR